MPKTNLSNTELVAALGLPTSIITDLQKAQGSTYESTMNDFLTNICNKLVYQKVYRTTFTNPFGKYDSYPVNYGDSLENLFIEPPVGYTFDKDATDPFTKYVPNIKPLYASINYEMQYPTTIQDVIMRRAALNPNGFMEIVNGMVDSLSTAKNVDEYTATICMLNNPDLFASGIEKLEYEATISNEEKYKAVTQKIIDVVTDFAIPSKDNNKLKVLTATPRENCLLIIKQEILNHINLDYLAGVYNLSKVDLISNIIGVRSFQYVQDGGRTMLGATGTATLKGEDIDFMIIDSKGFDNHVALEDSGMIYNPKGKYTNHFMNLWKIISFKKFANARAFKITTKA